MFLSKKIKIEVSEYGAQATDYTLTLSQQMPAWHLVYVWLCLFR